MCFVVSKNYFLCPVVNVVKLFWMKHRFTLLTETATRMSHF